MYIENFENGDIRVTFTSKESYWDLLQVAEFKIKVWAVRIYDKQKYHLANDFPNTMDEYYKF